MKKVKFLVEFEDGTCDVLEGETDIDQVFLKPNTNTCKAMVKRWFKYLPIKKVLAVSRGPVSLETFEFLCGASMRLQAAREEFTDVVLRDLLLEAQNRIDQVLERISE